MSVPKVRNVLEFPDQHPVAGAVAVLQSTAGKAYQARTDATGKWSLRVPGGEYTVTETLPEGLAYTHSITVPKGYLGTYNVFDLLKAV